MVIYFFKDRSKERVDFNQLIDEYLDKLENTEIISNDAEFIATFKIPHFNCSYRYLITKRSRVSSLYRLNANYVNTFLLCEIPDDVPLFVYRMILKQIDELCNIFEFAIYYEYVEDITSFNMFELITVLAKNRTKYLAEHPEIVKYPVEQDFLNEICMYQSLIDELPSVVKDDIVANPYIVLRGINEREGSEDHIYFCVNWRVGMPTTFPPHLDFVQIEEEDNLVNLVPIQVFNKYVERLMFEIKDPSIDIKIRYLTENGSLKARKFIKKMRKSFTSTYNYVQTNLTSLIEKVGE